MPEIQLVDVGVDYESFGHKVVALDGISLSLPAGEALSIIGPSGCGKSTLLYVLSGLLPASRGTVLVDGQPLIGQRKQTALILQDYGLFPWYTVFDNVALGLKVRHYPLQQINIKVEQILKDLGLWDLRKRYPSQLSGGQRQRVAIARSLTLEPDVLLMDEPFSSLDALTREELQNTILEIWQKGQSSKNKLTMILVTHNIEEAAFLGKRIAVMSMDSGRITELVENHEMGELDYRNTSQFYEHCARLRLLLKDGAQLG